MKYVINPIVASIGFIISYLWNFDYKGAKKFFRDVIEPDKFHYYE